MSRVKKTQIIDSLQETFSKCSISILTDYRGLTTSEITNLRRRLQESGNEYKVVKNTLARFAVERAGKDDLASSFNGPIAIAFGYGDITTPAKVLIGYIHDSASSLSIKGGFLDDRLLTSEEVTTLSTLPSREILLAQVLGRMKSPVSGLLNCLVSPMRGIMGVLQARINQLEGE
jgi:large subunit ribosomal protein L10|tara:strand:- start:73 stop:597 length:525 start_codon:yes stop_codon:yes gene_type:complete